MTPAVEVRELLELTPGDATLVAQGVEQLALRMRQTAQESTGAMARACNEQAERCEQIAAAARNLEEVQ